MSAAGVVVAMAARAPLSGSSRVDAASARAPAEALLALWLGAGMVALAGTLALLMSGRGRADDDSDLEPVRRFGTPVQRLTAVLLASVLGVALVAAAEFGVRAGRSSQRRVGVGRLGSAPTRLVSPTRVISSRSPDGGFVVPGWLGWVVLAVMLVAAGGVLVAAVGRRRSGPVRSKPAGPSAASDAVRSAMEVLRTPLEPREAVIAAYAAMERTLAARGVVRAVAEAPREYLSRVLVADGTSAAHARTLTALFEEARFSTHPIPERSRERAWAVLSSLRGRLDGPAR